MDSLCRAARDDPGRAFDRIDDAAVVRAGAESGAAVRIELHGAGRGGLQIEGLALRLVHPALPAAMAGGSGPAVWVLPMGSLFKGAGYILLETGYILLETMILKLRALLGATSEALRANHTDLE